MNKLKIPKGWRTLADAAEFAGVSLKRIQQIARRIKPNEMYPPDGRIYGVADKERTTFGRDIVSKMHGRLVICDAAVETIKQVEEEMKARGLALLSDFASQVGVSTSELRRALNKLRKEREENRLLDLHVSDMTLEETAEELGVGIGAVRGRTERIDERLRRTLGKKKRNEEWAPYYK